ncbi:MULTISPECIES: cysteine hydrolase family protein [Planococcus]|uniref:Nicotinamidase-related amidase n=1 Tax=Planococcus citreus TaxID=1373 RepID=A0A497YF48_9BACL|nr:MULTISPECIES: isochorismatase family cysteine hydrolase [Planococcus]MDE0584484.1 cysteine hydrolase [Planococcus sp. A6]RLJ86945.1 nicotinamidase-related amidase [Planococcus citreus]
MKKALLVVDYTVDFVAEDGALTCGAPGQEIEEAVCFITEQFIENGDFVVMPVDLHEENDPYHPETKLFPPHNIKGTDGRKLYGRLQDVYDRHHENIVWMDKTRYSAFAGTRLELMLRERSIEEVHIIGVCTDICVLHTAIDAYNEGFQIVIHEQAVASFDDAGHRYAMRHFETILGAQIR